MNKDNLKYGRLLVLESPQQLTKKQIRMKEYNRRARQKELADPKKHEERLQKMREYNKQYKLRHPDRVEDSRVRSLYGKSRAEILKMEREQNHCCALCGLPFGVGKWKRFIDHDHDSTHVRGLLHSICNTYLGIIENKTFREMAERYLERTHHEFSDKKQQFGVVCDTEPPIDDSAPAPE